MAQAFDDEGRALGPELIRESPHEALEAVMRKHMDASEYRVRKLRETLPEGSKLDTILDKLDSILVRLDAIDQAVLDGENPRPTGTQQGD